MPVESKSRWREKFNKAMLGGVALLWFVGLGFGLRAMLNYENAPALAGSPPKHWPAASRIARPPGLPIILVMAHPHCPCTRATIGELALLMTHVQNRAAAVVVFVRPDGVSEGWAETDLLRAAQKIPGVGVMVDQDGREAALFGALASGQTMLYDSDGRLEFAGGITASRGHSGDNAGRAAIASLVTTGKAERRQTPVYGCSLAGPTREDEKGK